LHFWWLPFWWLHIAGGSRVSSTLVAVLSRIVEERADLSAADVEVLSRLVGDWLLLSDLALSDLVLWVPTWNDGGLVAAAHVRPTTAPTSVPEDVPGAFAPRGRYPTLDQAAAFGRPVMRREATRPSAPVAVEAYPVKNGDRVIGVVARHASIAPRVAGQLEEIYLSTADDLFAMLGEGTYPVPGTSADTGSPRVGDGVIRLDGAGRVSYASPNAISAMRHLGLATDVVGSSFAELATRLSHRPGPVDGALSAVTTGRVAGSADLENASATVHLRGIPLARRGVHAGTIVFLQDVTDLRRRERALLSKDATIREIHHRVKNNLQTVAAMLRLQARRAGSPEAKEALAEAELRVGAIAVVHESLTADAGERVDFDDIADRIIGLVRDLAPGYAAGQVVPAIERTGSLGSLSADLATPLAMVLSELLHNAVEHASASLITVHLTRSGREVELRVQDDGGGLPAGFDAENTGLGLSIVQSLVTGDLRGTCSFSDEEPGATVLVQVPGA
jgi:two-component sensor histidine kinase